MFGNAHAVQSAAGQWRRTRHRDLHGSRHRQRSPLRPRRGLRSELPWTPSHACVHARGGQLTDASLRQADVLHWWSVADDLLRELDAGVDAELLVHVAEVAADGEAGDVEAVADLAGGEPFGGEGDHSLFGGGEAAPPG